MAEPEDRPADPRGSEADHDDVDTDRHEGRPGGDGASDEDDISGEPDSTEDGSGENDATTDDDADAADEPSDSSDEPEPTTPPLEAAPFIELMAAYRQPATAGAERLPWSWPTLSPGEREASATVLDGFVESYNRIWAISDTQAVPPCWHRHPALAHDLATLAWAYYQAYRDPTATPDLALRFQAQLPGFAERVDRWLGADPDACRAGQHPATWHDTEAVTEGRRSSAEDTDAVVLLGFETFGFAPPPPPTTE